MRGGHLTGPDRDAGAVPLAHRCDAMDAGGQLPGLRPGGSIAGPDDGLGHVWPLAPVECLG